jgi:hypothetical protein
MDSNTRVELEAFHRFLEDQLSSGACPLSPEECLDLWRAQHPLDWQVWADINSVKEALADMDAGDSGRPFDQFRDQFRKQNRFPA